MTPNDRRAALDVIGVKVVVLASGTDSGTPQITLQSGDEGAGPPPHSHDWDESFYVIRGRVDFACDDATTTCTAGTFVHVPAGSAHAFRFGPGGGEMLEVTGGQSRAIDLFTALAREIPPGPPDVPRVVAVGDEYGLKVHL
ncbi:MAG: cupin domain-containing protein [Synechococcaceae cyanobacterium]|nr:cupin domain-containing protein [Synechococcaceae cyanobacterium]